MIKRFLDRLARDDSGATALEYGLIIALIFLTILGSLTLFGDTSSGLISKTMTTISDALG